MSVYDHYTEGHPSRLTLSRACLHLHLLDHQVLPRVLLIGQLAHLLGR